jgi:hypothetical protein
LKRQFIETLRQGKKYSEKTIGNLELVDESIVNADLIVKLTQHIIASDEAGKAQAKKAKDAATPDAAPAPEFLGAILIFVPGLANIQGKLHLFLYFYRCIWRWRDLFSRGDLSLYRRDRRAEGLAHAQQQALERAHPAAALLALLPGAERGLPDHAARLPQDRGQHQHRRDLRHHRGRGVRDRHLPRQGEQLR